MWYEGEGMDSMEFTEAESNIQDLMCVPAPSPFSWDVTDYMIYLARSINNTRARREYSL